MNVFQFPQLNISIDGSPAEDYGLQGSFVSGELVNFSYGSVFGPDCRELIFETGNDGMNLLIMGDSYDNAIVKALSSDTGKCYCVDLRAVNADSFNLTDYIAEREIDVVLFIGAVDYFSNTLF